MRMRQPAFVLLALGVGACANVQEEGPLADGTYKITMPRDTYTQPLLMEHRAEARADKLCPSGWTKEDTVSLASETEWTIRCDKTDPKALGF
jgi:hypothetical protein